MNYNEAETSVVKGIKEQDAGETYKIINRKWNLPVISK